MTDGAARMIFLGFGKYVRADKIYALEPLAEGQRGSRARTRVWVDGIADPIVRSLEDADAQAVLDLHIANREFLARFDPVRDDDFFTLEAHRARIAEAGRHSWLILDDDEPAGFVGLSNIVRGPLQSAILSY